ncbi:hypothetical protein RJ639_018490 [Escallonia herrerae]|uniref:Uncharacterized protein n=1 Tax=Escallonia herrerae TaxID=1293975 RepID=A0AA88V9P1_9ASTE|nr:hypothetical protein RJ639_018490 [Escallonia herrerae]
MKGDGINHELFPKILRVEAVARLKELGEVNKPTGRFNALLCVGQFFSDSPDRLDEFTNFNKG